MAWLAQVSIVTRQKLDSVHNVVLDYVELALSIAVVQEFVREIVPWAGPVMQLQENCMQQRGP